MKKNSSSAGSWGRAVCILRMRIAKRASLKRAHFFRRRNGFAMPALHNRRTGLQIAAVLCALAAAAVFYNSFQCGLVFDDESAVKKNKDLRSELRSWWDLLKHDFWGATLTHKDSHKSYRPLTVATFRLNYMLHELQPLGYHLVNVLLHSAVCYLYVLLCGVVFSEVWPALIAGLLFAVHPIHTEAVSHTHSSNFVYLQESCRN